ncbi:MAG: hypothetical protein JO104_01635, partial [Candidatus Eremiobacteraeota bacterium]|nr:hypothetical protein [Candidatus Eremiobacteraeota bacterium]
FELPAPLDRARGKLRQGTAFQQHVVPQLRLLAVAEIDVEVRGGEPFTVGSPPQKVLECAGPWRVEIGWFDDAAVARDEYDLLLEDGQLYRIYRQGTRWYLRGAYD